MQKNNAKKIFEIIQKKYNKNIKYEYICNQLTNIRKIIAEFLKNEYKQSFIGGLNSHNIPRIIALDESLFCHDDLGQIWVVGGIDTQLKNVRLDIIRERNANNLSIFLNNHFLEGTHFIHDVWQGYSFLNNNINYTQETHNHGAGYFCFSSYNTPHIEALWSEMKREFVKIYGIMPKDNFVYFLRKMEFRFIVKKFGDEDKMNTFIEIVKKVFDKCKFKFSSKSNIENFNNYA